MPRTRRYIFIYLGLLILLAAVGEVPDYRGIVIGVLFWGITTRWVFCRIRASTPTKDHVTPEDRLLLTIVLTLVPSMGLAAIAAGLWVYLYSFDGARGRVLVYGVFFLTLGFAIGHYTLLRQQETRERRIREYRCVSCDYELRGTIEAGNSTCPECGTPLDGAAGEKA